MSVSFRSPDAAAKPDHIAIPGQTTVTFGLGSSLASEQTRIVYDLDPNGTVTFSNGGFSHQSSAVATASGIVVSDPLGLAGTAPRGTIDVITITITGIDGNSQVEPAFIVTL